MAIAQSLIAEFDHEMATTRRVIERVPDARFAWKPHPKSMSMGELATHIANVPFWGKLTITTDTFDMAPGGQVLKSPEAHSVADVLALLDQAVIDARAAIAGASDAAMMASWSLLRNGQSVLSMPRIAVLRTFVMNHLIHHRGQLSVYLRLNDIPVPSIYGQSADEKPLG